MKTTAITSIFSSILFVLGVILLIVGFFIGSSTVVKTLAFPNYPLPSWEENRCEYDMWYPAEPQLYLSEEVPQIERLELASSLQKEQQEKKVAECQASVAQQRRTKQVEDGVAALTLVTSGMVLVLSFKGLFFAPQKG